MIPEGSCDWRLD